MTDQDIMLTDEDIMLTNNDEIEVTYGDENIDDELDSLLLEDEEDTTTVKKDDKKFTQNDLHEAARKAAIAERNKYKKQIAKMQTSSTNTNSFDEDVFLETEIKKYMSKGYSEEDAKIQSEDKLETKRELENIKSLLKSNDFSLKDHKKNIELAQMKLNPIYKDLEDEEVEESIITLSEKTGLNLKQSYNALYAETKFNQSRSEIERQVEERIRTSGNLKNAMSTNTNSASQLQQKKINLTSDEREIAKMVGMTDKEYYLSKNIKTLDQYKKFKKK